MNDKMRDALKGLLSLLEQNLRGNDDDDVCLEIRLAREALAHPEHPEHHGAVSGWYCAHCQQGVDPVDVTFGETHVYCGRPVKDCPAPPAPSAPDEMWAGPPHTVDFVNGWNACRDAMLAASGDAQ